MSRVRQRRRGAQGDGRRALRLEFGLAGRGATSIASRPSCASARWHQQGPEEGGSEFPGGEQEGRAVTGGGLRSEEHTSELQSLMRISYAVFCLKKTKYTRHRDIHKK